jgi:polyisoprenoid-binding protein YceI
LRQATDAAGPHGADEIGVETHAAGAIEQAAWRVDRSRSAVVFWIRHFGVATVRGCFASFAGRVDVGEGALRVEGHVDVASVETGHEVRDARLRTEFFDAERHPAIVLRACGLEGGRRLDGELTIRGVTRPVGLALTVGDGEAVHMRADTSIRRSDFGLQWEALRDAGRLLVADEVRLRADVVLTRL